MRKKLANLRMRIDDIEKLYNGEWVLLHDLVQDADGRVVEGAVVTHSPDADVVYGEAARLQLKKSAIRCFQDVPEGTAFVF